jgi:hypothetical protein
MNRLSLLTVLAIALASLWGVCQFAGKAYAQRDRKEVAVNAAPDSEEMEEEDEDDESEEEEEAAPEKGRGLDKREARKEKVTPQGGKIEVDRKFVPAEIDQKAMEQAIGTAVLLVAFCVTLLIALVIELIIILITAGCLKKIPPEFRLMSPGMVWLLLIPVFDLIWNFFVFVRLSKSYQRYFAARGRTEFGDCAEKIGLWCAICCVCAWLPFVGYAAGPASLVLLIVYLVKVVGLKKHVTA